MRENGGEDRVKKSSESQACKKGEASEGLREGGKPGQEQKTATWMGLVAGWSKKKQILDPGAPTRTGKLKRGILIGGKRCGSMF